MSSTTRLSSSSATVVLVGLSSFVAGVLTTAGFLRYAKSVKSYDDKKKCEAEDKKDAGATAEGNDLSLFYSDDIDELTTVTQRRKFLPSEVYGQLVRDTVVCCLDVLLVRRRLDKSSGRYVRECLLVKRSSEPVKGVWWLPGGRILKGETFFVAAKRKAREETGLDVQMLRPVQVLGVWNTFFPTSHWDTSESKGTQTVNPIVLVEIDNTHEGNEKEDDVVEVKLDETSEQYKWIGLDPNEAIRHGVDKYVVQALLRLKAWNANY